MQELYEKRLELRRARGGMEIESDEAKLVINEEGRCVDIVKRTRGVSECMIEEFMLLANQCAANAGRTHQVPFVYRVHEAPDEERMEKLRETLKACGLNVHFKGATPTQLELAAILDETREMPIHIPVHTGILRSMQKARYSPEPLGHFGLVLKDYAHFTSPIRRYPDLAIHRILTDMLVGAPHERLVKNYNEFAAHTCEQSSRQEVAAVRIERDVEDCYKAEYMHGPSGARCIPAPSPALTPRGVFVALENTVEGFVPAAQLCKGEPTVTEGVRLYDPLTGRHWMLGRRNQNQGHCRRCAARPHRLRFHPDVIKADRCKPHRGRSGPFILVGQSHNIKVKRTGPRKNLSFLVGVTGFEPTASWSRTKRATICATPR